MWHIFPLSPARIRAAGHGGRVKLARSRRFKGKHRNSAAAVNRSFNLQTTDCRYLSSISSEQACFYRKHQLAKQVCCAMAVCTPTHDQRRSLFGERVGQQGTYIRLRSSCLPLASERHAPIENIERKLGYNCIARAPRAQSTLPFSANPDLAASFIRASSSCDANSRSFKSTP